MLSENIGSDLDLGLGVGSLMGVGLFFWLCAELNNCMLLWYGFGLEVVGVMLLRGLILCVALSVVCFLSLVCFVMFFSKFTVPFEFSHLLQQLYLALLFFQLPFQPYRLQLQLPHHELVQCLHQARVARRKQTLNHWFCAYHNPSYFNTIIYKPNNWYLALFYFISHFILFFYHSTFLYNFPSLFHLSLCSTHLLIP